MKIKRRKTRTYLEENRIKVIAKGHNRRLYLRSRIVVKGEGYHKTIPAVIFSPADSQMILEIVDKVEKDTIANILYK